MQAPMLDCPLGLEGRMLVGGTGIGSYARELERAQAAMTARPLILADRRALDAPQVAPLGRPGRWLRALWPVTRRVKPGGTNLCVVPDLFRLAQVWFDVHRRPLPVRIGGPPGIMHWTYPVPLRIVGWRNLYTVHDAIPLLHPDLTPIPPQRHRRLLAAILPHADRIVTVSAAARGDIVRALGCDPDRVVDCGEAVEPLPSDAALPEGLGPGRYLLAVGSVEKRKNLGLLAQAYAQSGVTLPLVIAGPDGWQGPEFAEPGIVRLPYLPEPVIRALIGNARALVMPSLAEGFGLPVVEAMALGTPVVTSGRHALAEVAGDAALLVDPADENMLAEALRRIATDDALVARLADAGGINARRFTRARFAARLEELYESVLRA